MNDIRDKVAIVTGAASGIGRAAALRLAKGGARLVLADRTDAGEAVAQQIRNGGGQAVFVATDVSQAEQCERLVQQARTHFGGLHIAFNNAGIADSPQPPPTHEYPLDLWRRIVDVNLSGVFYCLRYEIAAMLESGGGSIINTSSLAGQVAFPGAPAYVASKHGVVGLTKVVAVEYAARGIRCNAVAPGFIETPMTHGVFANEQARQYLLSGVPAARMGTPEEIAEAVAWLASDAAAYVNGAFLPVDGGYLSR